MADDGYLLDPGTPARSGDMLQQVRLAVLHQPGVAWQRPPAIVEHFRNRDSSVHGIFDHDGELWRLIPENEEAHHSGTLHGYTPFKDLICGADGPPWWWALAFEVCQIDSAGNVSDETWNGLVRGMIGVCERHALIPSRIVTHEMLVGWENSHHCPPLFHHKPDKLEELRFLVAKG